jgi:FtsZ-binding cell division protein ZapB
MNDIQQLEKTIGDLMLTIESLQRGINELKVSNTNLESKLRLVNEAIDSL